MARDVAAMDLFATELVVLSACDTGVGQVQLGEGVFGLRRAFAVAGARTLVISLWKVPDTETALLMELFYKKLVDGSKPAQALRLAQLELKRAGYDVHAWGAFVSQGI
jgi:CHAT domain-containing protein